MAELYQDKSEDKIKTDISEQFQKDDSRTRDDYEIYASARKVINSYIKEITTSKESYGDRALQGFEKLYKELSKEMDTMTGCSLAFKNKEIINDIASRIDDAEKEVISRLALNRTNKTTIEAQKTNPEYFTIGKDKSLLLTAGVNKPTIDEVLGQLFKGKNEKYKIDYTQCTNAKIKGKMMSLVGTGTCYINYDATQKTYLLKNDKGEAISQRALIREGVKLTPMGVVKFTAEQDQEKIKQEKNKKLSEASTITGNLDDIKKDPKRSSIIKKIPAPLLSKLNKESNIDASIFKTFLEKNEKRMDEIIQDAKAKNYILQTEPVSKINFGSGLMEVHLIGGTAKKDVAVWDDNHTIDSPILYDILDGEEGAYKEFLTSRLAEKRNDYDYLTKKEDILAINPINNATDKQETNIEDEKRGAMIEALGMFKKMLNTMKEKEGDSWDDDDMEFVAMIRHIDNSIYALENNENIAQQSLETNIIEPLRQKWLEFTYDNTGTKNSLDEDREKGTNDNLDEDEETLTFKGTFANIFSGDKEKLIDGIRLLGLGTTTFGNTHTSFLKDEIVGHLEISDEVINSAFQNISTQLEVGDMDTPEKKKEKEQLIDTLYETDGRGIATILSANGMLPQNLVDNKDILAKCGELKSKLSEKKSLAEKSPYTLESLAEDQINKKLELEAKTDPTTSDMMKLQALQYLIDNPDAQKIINQETLDAMNRNLLYNGVGKLIMGSLAPTLVELGGGAKGKNAYTYNDIVGYGNFNLSDENAEIAGEITKEILITVVVCIATAGIGGIALGATLRLVSAGVRAVKRTNMANRIIRFVEIGNTMKTMLTTTKSAKMALNAFKALSATEKVANVTYAATALLIEAPVFNSVTKAIKSTLAGKEIDMSWSDLNPVSKENIQTAAFLGSMQVVKFAGSAVNGMIKVDLGKAFETFKNTAEGIKALGKFSASTLSEIGTMMSAEQMINLSFGREEIDPTTGEMHIVRGLHMPSQQELAQMIGIILGMRAFAKFSLMPRVESLIANSKLGIKFGSWVKGDMTLFDKSGKQYSLKDLASPGGEQKLNEIAKKSPQHKKAIQQHQSGAQHIEKSGLPGKDRADIKRADNEQKVETIKEADNLKELEKAVQDMKGINAYKNAKIESDGSVSPSGDKEYTSSAEINKAIESGNFETLNFQKGDPMLALRTKGVELYMSEKIQSIDDIVSFVQKNTKLFGGATRQTKLIEELQKPGKTDTQKLTEFNKRIQSYQEISGPNSKSGFDMKGIIDAKIQDMLTKIESVTKPVADPVQDQNIQAEKPIKESKKEIEARKKVEKSESELNTFKTDITNYKQRAIEEILKLPEGEQVFRENKITKQGDKIILGDKELTKEALADFLYDKKLDNLQKQYDKSKDGYDKVKSVDATKEEPVGEVIDPQAATKKQNDVAATKNKSMETKVEPGSGDNINQLVEEAMQKAGPNDVVIIKDGKVLTVDPNMSSPSPIEMRFQDGSVEKGPRREGKLEGPNCERTRKSEVIDSEIKEYGEFKNGTLEGDNCTMETKHLSINLVSVYTGKFIDGELSGLGKKIVRYGFGGYKPDGEVTRRETILEGKFENIHGKRMCQGKSTASNGTIEEGKFEDFILIDGKVTNKEGQVFDVKNGKSVGYDKPFNKLTLQDWQNIGGLYEWKSYIQKNELRKDESLSFDKEGKKNIDVSKKQKFEDLTLEEFSRLVENIQAKKTNIEANAKLSETERIVKAKELLGDITPPQEQAIIEAHNKPGEIYNLDFSQIKTRVKILQKAGLTHQQIKILMENGICGHVESQTLVGDKEIKKVILGDGSKVTREELLTKIENEGAQTINKDKVNRDQNLNKVEANTNFEGMTLEEFNRLAENTKKENTITNEEYKKIVQEEENIIMQEDKAIVQDIKANKDNPNKIGIILSNLTSKIKSTSRDLVSSIRNNDTMTKQTKAFMRAMGHMTIFNHVVHEVKTIISNPKEIFQSIKQGEWYKCVGASMELVINLGMFTAITAKHINYAIHGDMLSIMNINSSFTVGGEMVKNASKYIKECFIVMEGQKIAHNKIKQLGEIGIEQVYQNKKTILPEYLTETKKLSENINSEQNIAVFKKFMLEQQYDMKINDKTEIQELFKYIVKKMNTSTSIEECNQHRKNINELANMIAPDKLLYQNMYNIVKKSIIGEWGISKYDFHGPVEANIAAPSRLGLVTP